MMTVEINAELSCGEELNWQTNKAKFVTKGDYVYKKYFRSGSAERDAALLTRIADTYRESESGGWHYRALRVVPYDESSNEIVMERLYGETLRDAFERTRNPSLFVHGGRWLGYLHQSSKDADGSVLAFNDYNRSNVLIVWDKRETVALDPGGYTSIRNPPGVSFFIGIFSIVRGVCREDVRLVPAAICHYLRGYHEAIGGEKLPAIFPGARYVYERIRQGSSKTLVEKPGLLRMACGAIECTILILLVKLLSWRNSIKGT